MPAELLNQSDFGYTAYKELNDLLVRFAHETRRDRIWFSAEAEAICRNRLGARFLKVMRMALDTARRYCSESASNRDLMIRLRSRHVQKQLFIKISYTSREGGIPGDVNIEEIRRIMTETGCYFRIRVENEQTNLNLAIPD